MEFNQESSEPELVRVLLIDGRAGSVAMLQDQIGGNEHFEFEWQKDYDSAMNACLSGEYDVGLVGAQVSKDGGEEKSDGIRFIEVLRENSCRMPLLYLTSSEQLNQLDQRRLSHLIDVLTTEEVEEDGLEQHLLNSLKMPDSDTFYYEARERLSVTLNCVDSGIIIVRENGAIDFVNLAAEKFMGVGLADLVGKPLLAHFQIIDEVYKVDLADDIVEKLGNHEPFRIGPDVRLVSKTGQTFAVECKFTPLFLDGTSSKSGGFVIVISDISEKISFNEQLHYEASHDRLTGLPNRVEFEKCIQDAIDSAQEYDQKHCVLYLDVDQFKVVNDTCGHLAGDEMLVQLGELLRKTVRRRDTVARLGGDEFGVVLWRCSREEGEEAVRQIMEELANYRFQWNDKSFVATVSIGMVTVDKTSMIWADVLSMADSACYEAKENGRNRVYIADTNDPRTVKRFSDMEWVSELMQGLEEGGFQFYAQEILMVNSRSLSDDLKSSITSKRTIGHGEQFEMLLRYSDRLGRTHLPENFLPAAQRYNIISLVDRWVVSTLLEWLSSKSEWLKNVNMISINLSGVTVQDERTLDYFLELLSNTSVDLSKINFEITETAAVSFIQSANTFIKEIKKMGCSFALDDFGAGVSSFTYLKHLPVDYIKLDGRLIKNIVKDPVDCSLVRSVNDIAHIMGKKTIATRCEEEEVYDKLMEIGVDYIQGYHIGKPQSIEQILKAADD